MSPEAPVEKFIGTYRWIGGMPEQRVLWRKIENIAGSFNFIAKPIVRDKLAAGNMIAQQIRIEADADTLLIHRDDKSVSAPLDGTSVKVRSMSGEMMAMSFKVVGNEIEQTFAGSAKGRVNRYQLEDATLVIHTRVYAAQLPRELVYELTYARVEPTAVAP